ncbi:MAG: hypothetical protein NTV86_05055 [Planctomycetota bacterium]|nr:hypothetical protein [Planctomycetota bacterium]
MSSIVPAAKLTRGELRQLGENVIYAVDHDGEELAAVNRSLSIHDECVDLLTEPSAGRVLANQFSPCPAA